MRLSESEWACCPFYIGHTYQTIVCEGAVDGCGTTRLSFDTAGLQRGHMYDYCERMNYKTCPVAKMLEEKYE